MPHDILLDVQELTIQYNFEGSLVPVVDQVSFFINRGEILALVGESGCGKTQVALALAGLLPKSAQSNKIYSTNLRTAMIFQDPMNALNPLLKVGSQIKEGIRNKTKRTKSEVLNLLNLVGIDNPEERYNQYPHEFSGGMRQRVLIAIALALKPQLLIADEPTTALDVTLEAQVIHLLRELKNSFQCSILFVSHNLGLIAELCDEVVVMYAGEVVETGDVFDLFHNPTHPYTQRLLECDPSRIERTTEELPTISGRSERRSALSAIASPNPRQ